MDLAINSPSAKKKPFNFILEAEYDRLPNSYVAPIYIEISHSDIYLIKEVKLQYFLLVDAEAELLDDIDAPEVEADVDGTGFESSLSSFSTSVSWSTSLSGTLSAVMVFFLGGWHLSLMEL